MQNAITQNVEAPAAVITAALDMVPARATYTRACIRGEQRWSGADLRGKAREWGGSYYRARKAAFAALAAAALAAGKVAREERRAHGLRVVVVE